ncbi:MAG: TfoX/Sxy family protein [Cytophaga sp.]|uniref:TfoX/Sxy family protein n=1 Tax=Cytophaga sp. TaxID=29535 RepID=UPI003F7FBA29
MAYDEGLAERIRKRFADLSPVEEKKMMGGLVFMYHDKMCAGIFRGDLMCRIDPELQDELVEENGCRSMVFNNRVMKGYILLDETAIRTQKQFNYWIDLALEFNSRAKSSKKKK